MPTQKWFLIENDASYKKVVARYEELRDSVKGSDDHKEKMLLVLLMKKYQETRWPIPDMDPVEIIKIRMEEFGYKAADLAKEFGDKGTVSKVLNYKKRMSLNMIRIFHKKLRIPSDLLMKEYELS
ncbi:MAG: transcriptional regulator [Ginsengibacter sp.]